MIAIPEIPSSLNFESIRCELRRCCRELESEIRTQAEQLCESSSGPEQQLLEEDIRELLVGVRWLRQRIRSFHASGAAAQLISATAREEWTQFTQQVCSELERIQQALHQLQQNVKRTESDTSDGGSSHPPGDINTVSDQAVVAASDVENNDDCIEFESASAECRDELCCC